MFDDYKESVLKAFTEIKKDGLLPSALVDPTSSKLKKECLDFFMVRYTPKDQEVFKSIFGRRNSAEEYYLNIKTSNADKFKPLRNFLKGETDSTHERNIELLAWLINFQPRPYQSEDAYLVSVSPRKKKESGEVEKGDLSNVDHKEILKKEEVTFNTEEQLLDQEKKEETVITVDEPHVTTSELHRIIPKKYYKTVGALIAALVSIISAYFYYNASDKKCMYWTGDKYVAIDCNTRIPNAIILDLDTRKVAHFKRITRPDTLTKKDIGHVWRSKKNGKVLFFTDSGNNPTDTSIRLLPLTSYMLERWGNISN